MCGIPSGTLARQIFPCSLGLVLLFERRPEITLIPDMLRVCAQVRVMMVLDGVAGAIVAPSISERVLIFAPLHFSALFFSWSPIRSAQVFSGLGLIHVAQYKVARALQGFASAHAVSLTGGSICTFVLVKQVN